ncbi:MAG: SH3 domain-containing protein [Clostridia bacterium]|nr:SH3 domain-containing protein [Clostridia bacterium]
MKKILSLALALLIVASTMAMTACGNKDKNPDDPKDPDTENPGTQQPADPAEITFTNVDERVKATVTVEIRLDPAMDVDNVIGNLRVGEIVTRTGVSTDGTWSRIRMTPAGFDEGEYYVSSNCLEVYTGPELPEDPTTDPEDPVVDPENPGTTDPEDPTTDPENPGTTDPEDPATPSFTAVEAYTWANPFVRMRAQSNIGSDVITTVPFGTKVQCVDRIGSWIEVIYGQYSGFIDATYLTLRDPNAGDFTTYNEPKTMVVNTEALTVRYYPFSETITGELIDGNHVEQLASIFSYLKKGDAVTVTGISSDGKWARIQWADGQNYYVYAKNLSGFTGGTTTPSTPSMPNTPSPTVTFEAVAPAIMYPTGSNVKYYSTPDTLTVAAGTLSRTDTVVLIAMSIDGEWLKINLSKEDTTPYYVVQAGLKSVTDGK